LIKFVLILLLNAFKIAPSPPVKVPLLVKFGKLIEELEDPAVATLLVFERVTPALTTKSSLQIIFLFM
jgi:hypothetical protein